MTPSFSHEWKEAGDEKQNKIYMKQVLDQLSLNYIKKSLYQISGEWNGDDSGVREERATLADEIYRKIEEIELDLKELNLS